MDWVFLYSKICKNFRAVRHSIPSGNDDKPVHDHMSRCSSSVSCFKHPNHPQRFHRNEFDVQTLPLIPSSLSCASPVSLMSSISSIPLSSYPPFSFSPSCLFSSSVDRFSRGIHFPVDLPLENNSQQLLKRGLSHSSCLFNSNPKGQEGANWLYASKERRNTRRKVTTRKSSERESFFVCRQWAILLSWDRLPTLSGAVSALNDELLVQRSGSPVSLFGRWSLTLLLVVYSILWWVCCNTSLRTRSCNGSCSQTHWSYEKKKTASFLIYV